MNKRQRTAGGATRPTHAESPPPARAARVEGKVVVVTGGTQVRQGSPPYVSNCAISISVLDIPTRTLSIS
jgi:hypothetical protein